MPWTARASIADMWCHVLNRGNRWEVVFHKPAEYDAFVKAMADAQTRLPVTTTTSTLTDSSQETAGGPTTLTQAETMALGSDATIASGALTSTESMSGT